MEQKRSRPKYNKKSRSKHNKKLLFKTQQKEPSTPPHKTMQIIPKAYLPIYLFHVKQNKYTAKHSAVLMLRNAITQNAIPIKIIANLDISIQIVLFLLLFAQKIPLLPLNTSKTTPHFACKRRSIYDIMYLNKDKSREIGKNTHFNHNIQRKNKRNFIKKR